MALYICQNCVECTAPRLNHNVNYRLWVIITCQCSFISYNKTWVGNVDNGGGYVRVASLVTQTGKEPP